MASVTNLLLRCAGAVCAADQIQLRGIVFDMVLHPEVYEVQDIINAVIGLALIVAHTIIHGSKNISMWPCIYNRCSSQFIGSHVEARSLLNQ